MASVQSSASTDAAKAGQFKTFPRPAIKVQGVETTEMRVDRFGNEMRSKQHRVSFIDRVTGGNIRTVYVVEAIESPSATKQPSCCKCLLM